MMVPPPSGPPLRRPVQAPVCALNQVSRRGTGQTSCSVVTVPLESILNKLADAIASRHRGFRHWLRPDLCPAARPSTVETEAMQDADNFRSRSIEYTVPSPMRRRRVSCRTTARRELESSLPAPDRLHW